VLYRAAPSVAILAQMVSSMANWSDEQVGEVHELQWHLSAAARLIQRLVHDHREFDMNAFAHRYFAPIVYQQLVAAGIASPPDVPAGSQPDACPNKCQCTSNQCWQPLCVRSYNNTFRPLTKTTAPLTSCPYPTVPNSRFCVRCLCSAPGCKNRTRDRTRFCTGRHCKATAWSKRRGTLDYCNAYGFFTVVPTWPAGLQVAAKWSWILCDIPPLDYTLFEELVQHVVGNDGVISRDGFVALALGHFLKWPPAVRLYTLELTDQPRPWEAPGLLHAFMAAVTAMDKQPLQIMHKSMSSKGRMHATTGLVVHAQFMGLIEKLDPQADDTLEKPVTKRPRTTTETATKGTVLTLGLSQQRFRVRTEHFPNVIKLVNLWLAQAPHVPRPSPNSPDSVEAIADAILKGITLLRRSTCSTPGGTVGPMAWSHSGGHIHQPTKPETPRPSRESSAGAQKRSKKTAEGMQQTGYLCQHFTRSVLMAMDAHHWHVQWHTLQWTMSKIARWCPDEKNQCGSIAEMPLQEAQERFACSPFMVSCWACFGSGLSQDELQTVLTATDRAVYMQVHRLTRRCHQSLEENWDQFSPVIQDIIKGLTAAPDEKAETDDKTELD